MAETKVAAKPAAKPAPAPEYEAVVGIKSDSLKKRFEPGDTVTGLKENQYKALLAQGAIKPRSKAKTKAVAK